MSDRLTKGQWIRQGLLTLAKHGPAALKVGPMATALKVSRGSFYWHFNDIADFRAQLLHNWQARATDQVIADLNETAEPERLTRLLKRAFVGRRGLDPAIRSWAADDTDVAKIVAAVDAKRIAYIAKLLAAAGVETRRSLQRATFLYWAYLGQTIIMDSGYATMTLSAMDELGALFES